jgi:type I restriction enzyme S subunit
VSAVVALGDVADVVAGVGFPKDMQGGQDGAIPVFKVGDISVAWLQGKNLLNESRNYLSAADAKSLGKCVPAGAIVFAKIGEALRLNRRVMLGRAALVDNNVMGLVPDQTKVSPKYLFYFMQTVDLGELSRSTTVPSIRKSDVVDIAIPVPPLGEQNEIVAELEKQFSRLDEAVANLQRVKANLKRYKASVLKAAVEGRLVETEASLAHREGRTYESGEQLLQRILEERRAKWAGRGKWKVPESPSTDTSLPDGWAWASIDQLAEVGTGATPKRDKATYWNDGDVPWVTSSVVNGDYVDEASEFVTKLALAETNLTLYPVGTLLIAMYGEGKTRGKCAELRIPAATNQALSALQVASSVRGYLRHFLELNYEEMRKVASGGVQPNLNLSLVRAVCVPLPPLSEQARMVAEVDRHLSIIREVEAEVDASLQRAQTLRISSLAKAFHAGPGDV